MRAKFFLAGIWMMAAVVGVAGCATTPPAVTVPISGNAQCHPASDLPTHKTMTKVPAVDTPMDELYKLFSSERADHAKDVQDYNSLWNTCVGASK